MNVTSTGIAVALAVVVALGFLFFGMGAFTPFTSSPLATMNAEQTGDQSNQPPLPTELTSQDTVVGTGVTAETGDTVTVEYVGALSDGTVFDASQNHGEPFTFTLGEGRVISGWDKGVVGMKEGGQRVLVVPPNEGYGAVPNGPIPANSTLLFQIQLVKVQKPQ